jgi:hypothetical protein
MHARSIARPEDFSVIYSWATPPVAPPGYWEYRVVIGPVGAAQVEMIPGYPASGAPTWVERFTVDRAHLEWLFAVMAERELFTADWQPGSEHTVGGTREGLCVTAWGRVIALPADVEPRRAVAAAQMRSAVRALVPTALWESLTARREAYARCQRERERRAEPAAPRGHGERGGRSRAALWLRGGVRVAIAAAMALAAGAADPNAGLYVGGAIGGAGLLWLLITWARAGRPMPFVRRRPGG